MSVESGTDAATLCKNNQKQKRKYHHKQKTKRNKMVLYADFKLFLNVPSDFESFTFSD